MVWGVGQYEDSQTSVVTDDAADEMSVLRGARITSFVSFTSVCSFYDAAGRVEGAHHPQMAMKSTSLYCAQQRKQAIDIPIKCIISVPAGAMLSGSSLIYH